MNRYLVLCGTIVVDTSGTLDEVHQRILKRKERPDYYTTVDLWSEEGHLMEHKDDRGFVMFRTWKCGASPSTL